MAKIIRVFRGRVKPGKQEEFKSFFLNQALPLVRDQEGLISVHVGLPMTDAPLEFLMITSWESVQALQAFSGENWRQAVIDPREKHLLDSTTVDHYEEASI